MIKQARTFKAQSGFALVMVISVMVALLAIIAGTFLNLTRNQRQAIRTESKSEVAEAVRSALDAVMYEFDKHVSENSSSFPDVAALTAMKDAALTKVSADYPAAEFTLSPFTFERTEGSGDSPRTYLARARVTNNYTKAAEQASRTVTFNTGDGGGGGSVFEYGVYYGDDEGSFGGNGDAQDIEIAPGENATFQGPIYTSGNIFLMSGVNKALNLNSPDDLPGGGGRPANDYVLKAGGHVYFGFKPVVGRNYINLKNGQVEQTYVGPDNYDGIFKSYYDSTLNSNAVIDPSKEEIMKLDVNEHPAKPLPWIYFLKNEILHVETSTDEDLIMTSTRHPIRVDGAPLSVKDITLKKYNWDWWSDKTFVNYGVEGNSYYTNDSMNYSGAYNRNALTTNFDPFNALTSDDPADDVKEFDPVENDLWDPPAVIKQDAIVGSGVLNLPAGMKPHQLIEPIVEGQPQGNDSQLVKNAKLMSQADFVVTCVGLNCAGLKHKVNGQDLPFVGGGQPPRVYTSSGFGINPGCFSDKRLNGNFRVITVDVGAFIAKWDLETTQDDLAINRKKAVLYFKTEPFSVTAPITPGEDFQAGGGCAPRTPIRMVVLKNANKLLEDGMTFITNGRMWVQFDNGGGLKVDFNTTRNAEGKIPPASLISDSFGVTETVDGGDNNLVSVDHTINAAVITGYLKSTLERSLPLCDGPPNLEELDKCFDTKIPNWRDNDPADRKSGMAWLKTLMGAQFAPNLPEPVIDPPNAQAGPSTKLPGTISGITVTGQADFGINCPGGLGVDGVPSDMENCNIWYDPSKGVFYYRRVSLLKKLAQDLLAEIEWYQDYIRGGDLARFNWSDISNLYGPSGKFAVLESAISDLEDEEENEIDYNLAVENIRNNLDSEFAYFSIKAPLIWNVPQDPQNPTGPKNKKILYYEIPSGLFSADQTARNQRDEPILKWWPAGSNVDLDTAPGTLNANKNLKNFFGFAEYYRKLEKNPPEAIEYGAEVCGSYGDGFGGDKAMYCREIEIDFENVNPDRPIPLTAFNQLIYQAGAQGATPRVIEGKVEDLEKNTKVGNVTTSYGKRTFATDKTLAFPSEKVHDPEPVAAPLVAGVNFAPIDLKWLGGLKSIDANYKATVFCDPTGQAGTETSPPRKGTCDVVGPSGFSLGKAGYFIRDRTRFWEWTGWDGVVGYSGSPPPQGWPNGNLVDQDLASNSDIEPHGPVYIHGRVAPMYYARYSGGVENLINFQEDWSGKTFTHYGILASPWLATELLRSPQSWQDQSLDSVPAYWNSNVESEDPAHADYMVVKPDYTPPIRIFNYDGSLATNPPPGMGVFGSFGEASIQLGEVRHEKVDVP